MEKKPLRAYCNATRYDFNALREFLENRHRVMLVRDCLQIELKEGMVFLFEYGGVVFWSCDYETQKALLDSIAPFSVGILSEVVVDDFEYILEPEASSRIHNDTIRLSEETPLQKLAFSHGIIQSTKLASFENLIQSTIDETRHLPESLAQSGKILLSRREIAKLRGKLFLAKADIHLHFELLDTPEFFWEYPTLEPYYQEIRQYLDIPSRIEVLGQKLSVIEELLTMLADEQNHKHSANLEWIIIILIAIEILLYLH